MHSDWSKPIILSGYKTKKKTSFIIFSTSPLHVYRNPNEEA